MGLRDLWRYYKLWKIWNKVKESDMSKWNSRKLVVLIVGSIISWVVAESGAEIDEATKVELVEKMIVPALTAIYLFVQGLVDRESAKAPPN